MSTTNALFRLGMDLEAQHRDQRPGTAQTEECDRAAGGLSAVDRAQEPAPIRTESDERYDHFVVKDGVKCAGTHLIIDLYDAKGLDDLDLMESTLRKCVDKAGATLLHFHLHHFTPNDGISGVAVLAESHISVHTWPEAGYGAFDVFMCGDATPEVCVEILRDAFAASRVAVGEHLRGRGA